MALVIENKKQPRQKQSSPTLLIRGRGVHIKVSDFPCKNILYLDYEEPISFHRIKMSLTAAEIWLDKVGTYLRYFMVLYMVRKMLHPCGRSEATKENAPKIWLFEHFCNTFFGRRRSKSPWAWFGDIMNILCVESRIYMFLFLGHFSGHLFSIFPKNWKIGKFWPKMP